MATDSAKTASHQAEVVQSNIDGIIQNHRQRRARLDEDRPVDLEYLKRSSKLQIDNLEKLRVNLNTLSQLVNSEHQAEIQLLRTEVSQNLSLITSLKHNHREEIAKVHLDHEEFVAHLRLTHDGTVVKIQQAHEETILNLEQAIAQVQQTNKKAVAEMRQTHEDVIAVLQQNVVKLQQAHEGTVANLQQAHEETITDLQQKREEAIAELQEAHTQIVAGIQEAHSENVLSMQQAHEKNIVNMQQAHKEAILKLKQSNEESKQRTERDLCELTESHDLKISNLEQDLSISILELEDALNQSHAQIVRQKAIYEATMLEDVLFHLGRDQEWDEMYRKKSGQAESLENQLNLCNEARIDQQSCVSNMQEMLEFENLLHSYTRGQLSLMAADKEGLAAELLDLRARLVAAAQVHADESSRIKSQQIQSQNEISTLKETIKQLEDSHRTVEAELNTSLASVVTLGEANQGLQERTKALTQSESLAAKRLEEQNAVADERLTEIGTLQTQLTNQSRKNVLESTERNRLSEALSIKNDELDTAKIDLDRIKEERYTLSLRLEQLQRVQNKNVTQWRSLALHFIGLSDKSQADLSIANNRITDLEGSISTLVTSVKQFSKDAGHLHQAELRAQAQSVKAALSAKTTQQIDEIRRSHTAEIQEGKRKRDMWAVAAADSIEKLYLEGDDTDLRKVFDVDSIKEFLERWQDHSSIQENTIWLKNQELEAAERQIQALQNQLKESRVGQKRSSPSAVNEDDVERPSKSAKMQSSDVCSPSEAASSLLLDTFEERLRRNQVQLNFKAPVPAWAAGHYSTTGMDANHEITQGHSSLPNDSDNVVEASGQSSFEVTQDAGDNAEASLNMDQTVSSDFHFLSSDGIELIASSNTNTPAVRRGYSEADLDADLDAGTKVDMIWSMFIPAWDISSVEETVLKAQFNSIFARRNRSLRSLVEAIDLYIFGEISKPPSRPGDCLIARITGATTGQTGSELCLRNCKYCRQGRDDDRICCWAEYVPGAQIGCTAIRVNGKIPKDQRVWHMPGADFVVPFHGKHVRWILRKRKTLVRDPDIQSWLF